MTEPELPAVKVSTPSAVVAPSIEVATDQIRASDVDFIEGDGGPRSRPSRSVWVLAAGLTALIAVGGLVAALNFPRRPSSAPLAVQTPALASAPPAVAAPAAGTAIAVPVAPQVSDGLLEPLVGQHPKRGHSGRRRDAVVKAAASPSSVGTPQSIDRDFSFLSHDAPAPKDELKRPSF